MFKTVVTGDRNIWLLILYLIKCFLTCFLFSMLWNWHPSVPSLLPFGSFLDLKEWSWHEGSNILYQGHAQFDKKKKQSPGDFGIFLQLGIWDLVTYFWSDGRIHTQIHSFLFKSCFWKPGWRSLLFLSENLSIFMEDSVFETLEVTKYLLATY